MTSDIDMTMTSDAVAQGDELLVLSSIYDDPRVFSTTQSHPPSGQFNAPIKLPTDFQLISSRTENAAGEVVTRTIHYLPPVTLCFLLPAKYPSQDPPAFTLACKWLSLEKLSALCKKLDDLWTENSQMEILFVWTNFLKDEVLDFLQITSPYDISGLVTSRHKLSRVNSLGNEKHSTSDDTIPTGVPQSLYSGLPAEPAQCTISELDHRAIQDIASQDMLLPLLVEYDMTLQERDFRETLFTCKVCLCERLGVLCLRFTGCNHVYCKDCMRDYFTVQIEDGSVHNLSCPEEKCESQAHPGQVKDLVDEEVFKRYDRLLLQSSLDTMADIMYCPRMSCGSVVLIEQDSSMATCPGCHFVFCVYCKRVYHGVSPCRIQADELAKIREQYVNGTEEDKRQMEKRYGRRSIQLVVEESFTQEWLDEYSKKCPKCHTHIQKIDGCNKMTCTKCCCYFCWLCNGILPRVNPYMHFDSLNSDCFNRLFEGIIIEEEDLDGV